MSKVEVTKEELVNDIHEKILNALSFDYVKLFPDDRESLNEIRKAEYEVTKKILEEAVSNKIRIKLTSKYNKLMNK